MDVGVSAIQISRHGAPGVLRQTHVPRASLAEGDVRIRVTAAGVNFADIMMRMGLYPEAPKPPFVPGYEVAGVAVEVGRGVTRIQVGERVLAATRFGGYTTETVLPQWQVRKTPDHLTDIEAASIPVNFLTAWVALKDMARVRSGDRVLIHSAAGGVGVAAVQIAAQGGAYVVGVVGSREKSEIVKSLGAQEVLLQSEWESGDHSGFQVVLDALGGACLKKSYRALAPTGRVVSFGISSMIFGQRRSVLGAIQLFLKSPLFSPFKLMMDNRGVFGLNMLALMTDPSIMERAMDQVLEHFSSKRFRPVVGREFAYREAAQAHEYLQSRRNVGKIVLDMTR